jgi:hypothetical protein
MLSSFMHDVGVHDMALCSVNEPGVGVHGMDVSMMSVQKI